MTCVGLVGPPFPAEWVRQGFLPEGTPELTWQDTASDMPDGTVLLTDGRTTAEMLSWAGRFSVQAVLGMTMGRRLLSSNGWSGHQQPIHHHLVGGVTTFWSIMTLHHKEHRTYPDLELEVGRDASTILHAVNRSFHYRLAPSSRRVVPLALVNLGSSFSPVFHGGGLLPGHLSMDTRVLTPTIFQRQGFWGMRTLTWEELLSSLDVSELAQSHTTHSRNFPCAATWQLSPCGMEPIFSTPILTSANLVNVDSTATSKRVSIDHSNLTATSKRDSSSNTLNFLTAIDKLNNQRASIDHSNSTATSKRDSSSDTLKHLTAIDTLNNLENSKRLKMSHVRFADTLAIESIRHLNKSVTSTEGTTRNRLEPSEGTARQVESQNDEAPKKRVKKENYVGCSSS
jgi:hypothetical protein